MGERLESKTRIESTALTRFGEELSNHPLGARVFLPTYRTARISTSAVPSGLRLRTLSCHRTCQKRRIVRWESLVLTTRKGCSLPSGRLLTDLPNRTSALVLSNRRMTGAAAGRAL